MKLAPSTSHPSPPIHPSFKQVKVTKALAVQAVALKATSTKEEGYESQGRAPEATSPRLVDNRTRQFLQPHCKHSNSGGLLKSDTDAGGLRKGWRGFLRSSGASGLGHCLTARGTPTDQGSDPSLATHSLCNPGRVSPEPAEGGQGGLLCRAVAKLRGNDPAMVLSPGEPLTQWRLSWQKVAWHGRLPGT